MILTSNQKKILQKWFDAYAKMYNEGVKYIKTNYAITKHYIDTKNRSKEIFQNRVKKIKNNSR